MKVGDKVKSQDGCYTGFKGKIKEISPCGNYALVENIDLFSLSIDISFLSLDNDNVSVERDKEAQSLKSSLETPGSLHTQIIHFSGGQKRTFTDLDLSTIKEGKFTKIRCTKGYRVCINIENVDCFESHPQK